eukprot:TRINITY_DN3908_c0_g1_i1.p1 TRINITY_DN3908_c0_g1~~TRINITY_DN3908_c0_g1_i1.p1  ORF type:complete len:145 (+),score=19.64 TRINITY_DN3908_c0_g1_i1:437-871(+)
MCVFVSGAIYINFYGYHAFPNHQMISISKTMLLSTIVIFMIWSPKQREKRTIGFVLLYVIEGANVIYLGSLTGAWKVVSLFGQAYMSFFIGLVFYVTRFPERSFPGKFDMLKSHTIWHIMAVVGSVYFYWLILESFEFYSHSLR